MATACSKQLPDPRRTLKSEEIERIKRGVADWFARRIGASLSGMAPAVTELAEELVKLSKSRKPRSPWFHLASEMLAKVLRELLDTKGKAKS